jgi:hypothetical protein
MHIVLATPLYPPDIAPPAPYVKELAKRLSGGHQVTIVTYGKLPEQVAGVQIIAVPKNRMLLARLIQYTRHLLRAARKADILYAQNGASVELPLLLVSFITTTPIVLCFGDAAAHARTKSRPILRYLERMARARAKSVVHDVPPSRPIILPLEPRPEQELLAYEMEWRDHANKLERLFTTI